MSFSGQCIWSGLLKMSIMAALVDLLYVPCTCGWYSPGGATVMRPAARVK